MLPLSLEILLVLITLIVFALFSMVETSILTVRKSSLRKMIEDEDESRKRRDHAAIVLEIKSHPEEFLALVQSGVILSVIFAATFSSFIALDDVANFIGQTFPISTKAANVVGLLVTILTLAPLLLTFGGLIPKSIALHQNRRFALIFAPYVLAALRFAKAVTHFPVVLANIVLRPFKDSASFSESRISEEEFLVMLEEGKRTGIIDETENELIENIFDFREKTVREIMVPRTKIIAIDIESHRDLVIHKIVAEGYTRLPVYQDTLDSIIGVVYSKDVLALIEHPDLIMLYDIIRPVSFVPETKLIAELLRELQTKKMHLAIVIDEFGGTAGIATLEDILEEIVGEIHDEYDEEQPIVMDEKKHEITMSATLPVVDANHHLESFFTGFRIPEGDEYDSVGGYITTLFGHIPETNESFETDGVEFTVVKRTPKEVVQVRMREVGV
ncbi:MAG TPA: hemolysin family protein [Candidatus Kapabacteria bacterium]|nr:hemolysin family protein [Candidatus Kapabacteria bacterium]